MSCFCEVLTDLFEMMTMFYLRTITVVAFSERF